MRGVDQTPTKGEGGFDQACIVAEGLTTVSPLLLIPTLATTLANFEFPSEDQKEHERVQLVRWKRGAGGGLKNLCGLRIIGL